MALILYKWIYSIGNCSWSKRDSQGSSISSVLWFVCIYCWQDLMSSRELLINCTYLTVSRFCQSLFFSDLGKAFPHKMERHSIFSIVQIVFHVHLVFQFIVSWGAAIQCICADNYSMYVQTVLSSFFFSFCLCFPFYKLILRGVWKWVDFERKLKFTLLLNIGVWDKHYFCHFDLTIVEPNKIYVRPHSSYCIFPFCRLIVIVVFHISVCCWDARNIQKGGGLGGTTT